MATYDAGIVTAYGAAVRGGYTGTYEQFCAQQANYAASAAAVEQAKEDVEELIESIPEDYSTLSDDVEDLKDGLNAMSTATASDVGKALKAKTVSVGKVTEWEFGEAGSGLTEDVKQALLQIAEKVAYIDEDGQDYYNDLYDALYAVTAISLNAQSIMLTSIGSTQQLTATTTPPGGAVTWASSDTSIATVSNTGLVTSVGYGSCTITASSGSVSATCAVAVSQVTLTSISADYQQSGTVYDTASLDSLKNDLTVTATYSDSSTATVTEYTLSGTLTVGTSTITVSYGGKTATFNVTVTATPTLTSISAVYTQSGTVYDTDTLDSLKDDLVVTAHYSDSTTQTVTDYTLSGTLAAGTSTVTVSYGGKTTTFNVTVTHAVTDTTAEIATDGYVWEHKNSPGRMVQTATANGGITTKYELSQPSATLALAGIIPTDGVIVSGMGALMIYDENDENFNYIGECTQIDTRFGQDVDGTTCEYSWSWTLASSVYSIECSVDTRYLDDAYLYDVNTGQVLFAGSNTPYYGMSNISERVLPVTDTTADVDIEGYVTNWTGGTRSTVAKTYAGITKKYSIPATTILNPVGIIPIAKNYTITNDTGIITIFDSNDNIISHVSEKIASDTRWCKKVGFGDTITEYSKSWTVNEYTKIEFCVDMRYLADAYMYDGTTGQVFFAGKNTPYYGMENVSEANS